MEELSQKSRLLLEKGPAYQNDIAYVMLQSSYLIRPKIKHSILNLDHRF